MTVICVLQETINQERLKWDQERGKQNQQLEDRALVLKDEKEDIEKQRVCPRSCVRYVGCQKKLRLTISL